MRYPRAILCLALTTLVLGGAAGCYDSKSLIDEVRNKAIRTRLDELDLGYFRTTLPRSAVDDSPMEVEVEMYGTVVRHKIPALEEELKEQEYRLRQEVVIALRQTNANEIADPNLVTFRERLLTVYNTVLENAPIESLGFRQVRFIPL
ncbi:hypothetical protein [Aeoliella mucimassa]|uniref:Flagellar protein FliL n=1 Tax=Aeoliella mucimassa TaxID=2527972 RepID=A0A518AHT7_9BACT|nr:hypothetical protein [Aeoliella mucimassa]QDU54290.1 hypothetical protein Pan181_04710 [Aeoliella mucimassa]